MSAFAQCGGPEAVYSFASEVVQLRGNVKARQLLNVLLRKVEQSRPEWEGRLTAMPSSPPPFVTDQSILATAHLSSDTDYHSAITPSLSTDDHSATLMIIVGRRKCRKSITAPSRSMDMSGPFPKSSFACAPRRQNGASAAAVDKES